MLVLNLPLCEYVRLSIHYHDALAVVIIAINIVDAIVLLLFSCEYFLYISSSAKDFSFEEMF